LRKTPAFGLVLAVVALAVSAPSGTAALSHGHGGRSIVDETRRYRAETWRWQRLMGRPLTPKTPRGRAFVSPAYSTWLRDLWKARAQRARNRAKRPPHLRAWRCIHRYEGSWRDPDPLYFGGLQMDLGFQRTYGRGLLRRKGTANHWTPLEQMWTAERALRAGRGFHPWPLAARRCGLL
jgi:hypothetical protein